jgi:putative spermidine/putrescine transport system permease protein
LIDGSVTTRCAPPTQRGRAPSVYRSLLAFLGVVPFFAYVAVFFLVPTLVVAFGAFMGPQGLTTNNIWALAQPQIASSLLHSVVLAGVTAVIGAVFGSLLSYAVATSRRDGLVRRVFTTLCGVLAQFGGVALAFAFVATVGAQGLLTIWLQRMGLNITDSQWVYEWNKGLVVVYLYFQIPLMVLVFLPAIEGLRPEWREATQTLGGGSWRYWRHVAGPVLAPPFIGASLLLFANAFSAYATVAVLISQASPVLTLNIAGAMSSEVVLGQANVAKAMALAMVVVVALVMTLQALVERRTSKWLAS